MLRAFALAAFALALLASAPARADVPSPGSGCSGSSNETPWTCSAAAWGNDDRTCSECAAGDGACTSALQGSGYSISCTQSGSDAGAALEVWCKSKGSGCSTSAAARSLPTVGFFLLAGLFMASRAAKRA